MCSMQVFVIPCLAHCPKIVTILHDLKNAYFTKKIIQMHLVMYLSSTYSIIVTTYQKYLQFINFSKIAKTHYCLFSDFFTIITNITLFLITELIATWSETNELNHSFLWQQSSSFSTVSRSTSSRGGQNRPFACSTCHKTYTNKSNLGRHKRLECGKEPQFQCPYCPQRTTQNSSLQKHINRQHAMQLLDI